MALWWNIWHWKHCQWVPRLGNVKAYLEVLIVSPITKVKTGCVLVIRVSSKFWNFIHLTLWRLPQFSSLVQLAQTSIDVVTIPSTITPGLEETSMQCVSTWGCTKMHHLHQFWAGVWVFWTSSVSILRNFPKTDIWHWLTACFSFVPAVWMIGCVTFNRCVTSEVLFM